MKLKIEVDLGLSSGAKMWSLRLGVPLVVTMLGGVAFAGLPGGYADGQPLTKAELDANFNYLQNEITTLQNAPAPVLAIQTTVAGTAGGTQSVNCPSGYNLVAAALAEDHRNQFGTNGWDLGGTITCGISGNTLTASLTNYLGGTPQTVIQCFGICVHG